MRLRRINYDKDAQADLLEIGRYLARVASSEVADRFIERIRLHIRKLEYASERGTIRNAERGIRIIGVLPTVGIAFSVSDEAVTIHRVLHNGRNWVDPT